MRFLSRYACGAAFSATLITLLLPKGLAAQESAPAAAALALPAPGPITPGAKVVPLWPQGSPKLRAEEGANKPETLHMYKGSDARILHLENIHNPSIELHLAPPEKANGMAVIIAPGGGNSTLYVGPEGVDVADWLNGLGIHAFVERYRLRPYDSAVDALADTQQSIRLVRANAKEWGVDPKRVGIMGFSAGGEQVAWVTLRFDNGDAKSTDPVARESCRPDFSVLIYPGWKMMDLTTVPQNAPPTFITCAGVDDTFHAKQSVEFYSALLTAKIPVEMHLYGHGGHGGSVSDRKGIPFGSWTTRFAEWANDLKLLNKP